MSEVAQRNFHNFELGDNVYELADGLIPEIAERLDFDLGAEPDSQVMYKLVGVLGKNKVLRNNEEVTAINLETAADLLERSGVQKPLNRSLWTPEVQIDSNSGLTAITGAVGNWQDRVAELVAESIEAETIGSDIRVVTGNRVMDTKSDKSNSNVQAFHEEEGVYPTETQYAHEFVLPVVRRAGGNVVATSYQTDKGDKLAENFVREVNFSADPDIKKTFFKDGTPVTFARVANAGIQLATQFRSAIRQNTNPDFDAYPHLPEVFVLTDGFPIARTEEQKADSANYQSPYTGLRQVVLTAKVLHEAVTA